MQTIVAMYVTAMPVIITGVLNMAFCKSKLCKNLAIPIDGGKKLKDGKRIFGEHKTWKGLIGYICFGIISMVVWGEICLLLNLQNYFYNHHENTIPYNILIGFLLGLAYGIFELPNSFIKRRLGIKEGKNAKGKSKALFFIADQIDSIVGCCIVIAIFCKLNLPYYFGFIALGAITHIVVNLILYKLKLRKNMF